MDKRASVDALRGIVDADKAWRIHFNAWIQFFEGLKPAPIPAGSPKANDLAALWNGNIHRWERDYLAHADWREKAVAIVEIGMSNLEQLAVKVPENATPEEKARAEALAQIAEAYLPEVRAALEATQRAEALANDQYAMALAAQDRVLAAMPGEARAPGGPVERVAEAVTRAFEGTAAIAPAAAGLGVVILAIVAGLALLSFAER